MYKKYLVVIGLIAIVGCKPKEERVVHFSIDNGCHNNIFVEFVVKATGDTENIYIIPDETFYIREITLSPYEEPNWYYNFDFQINYIKNVLGDSVHFNPNISSEWGGGGFNNSPIYDYSLYIRETDF